MGSLNTRLLPKIAKATWLTRQEYVRHNLHYYDSQVYYCWFHTTHGSRWSLSRHPKGEVMRHRSDAASAADDGRRFAHPDSRDSFESQRESKRIQAGGVVHGSHLALFGASGARRDLDPASERLVWSAGSHAHNKELQRRLKDVWMPAWLVWKEPRGCCCCCCCCHRRENGRTHKSAPCVNARQRIQMHPTTRRAASFTRDPG